MIRSGTPEVSVLVPTYNRIQFVGAALASIREQDDVDFEVIVHDAGSTEPVMEELRDVVSDDSRFRLFATSERLSPPETRNAALAHARAPIVSLLDADDTMASGRLRLHCDTLTSQPHLAAIAGRMHFVDVDGLELGSQRPYDSPWPPLLTPAEIRWAMPLTSPALSSAVTARVSAITSVGGFNDRFPRCDDYALLWALSRIGDLCVLPEIAAHRRVHSEQVSELERGQQHREYISLRRMIYSDRLQCVVATAPVLALSGESPVNARVLAKALELLDGSLAKSMAEPELTEPEREWIVGDHARHVQKVRGRLIHNPVAAL